MPSGKLPEGALAVAAAGCAIFSMGGIIFGIASLYPVLYYERALESACDAACVAHSTSACCPSQSLQVTTITSMALFAADGAMIAYGELGDRCGPRACFGTGATLAWLGLLLLATASWTAAESLWCVRPSC